LIIAKLGERGRANTLESHFGPAPFLAYGAVIRVGRRRLGHVVITIAGILLQFAGLFFTQLSLVGCSVP
jgi:hypothetical protein